MTSQVRFVAALHSKKFGFSSMYSFGIYPLGKPVCLDLWPTPDITGYKEVTTEILASQCASSVVPYNLP